MKKFYTVKKGNTPGIYSSLEKARESIKGFSSPEWRGFETEEEAKAFYEGKDLFKEKIDKDIAAGYLVIFTDGSFEPNPPKYSYGIVILEKDHETLISQSPQKQRFLVSKNISGEIFGVIVALDWAIAHEYFKIKVYHDYVGISKMYNGEWKAEAAITQFFSTLVKEKYDGIVDVVFEKVKGHTHNTYNDKADALAREALQGKPTRAVNGGTFFCLNHISKDSTNAILQKIQDTEKNVLISSEEHDKKTVYIALFEKDKITITHFASPANKLLVQGKICPLFQVITAFLLELIDASTVITISSSIYHRTFNQEEIDKEFAKYCSNFPIRYSENLKKLLLQSIINLKTPKAEYEADCSYYVYPAFRALEGHIDYQLVALGIPKTGYSFSMFDLDTATRSYYLRTTYATGLASDSIDKLNKCYNYYNDKRHALSHFGNIIGATDNTLMVEKKEDANVLIEETLSLINDTVI